LPRKCRLLAVDVGAKRIGVALSDPDQTIAQPLATITRRAGKRFPMHQLKSFLDTHNPDGIVVGLPLTEDGGEDERTTPALEAGRLIQEKTGLPVCFWDERMSTASALRAVRKMGGRVRGRKGDVDQLAATVLLQNFLDARRA
jgi:putative Holliday junction resolvase